MLKKSVHSNPKGRADEQSDEKSGEEISLTGAYDSSDPGDETQRNFRYQHAYGVILLIASITGRKSYVSIWCEHHEDFLTEDGEGNYDAYANLGSGGKKTLFKCCFAVALHRLAVEIGALLPTILIIDTPMKNISERENKEQFEGFHRMLYELATNELLGTQMVLIDKEYFAPGAELKVNFVARHMKPEGPDDLPLISYYRGH